MFERAKVISIRADGVNVKVGSETFKVANGLNVRTPPGALVLVATDAKGRKEIVSRRR